MHITTAGFEERGEHVTMAKAAQTAKENNRSAALCGADMHGPYLKALGERVRNARALRGMTRKILARDSGVSERFLAQLEAGQGNISIARLRQIAGAMSLPLVDLVREGPDRPVELTLLLQRLERLSPSELTEASHILTAHFGRDLANDRASRIALIGLRGGGKTTLGRELAAQLGMPFVEMNKEIERDSGMSLNEIFSLSGQAAYRRYERRALERVIETHPTAVIATGGSLVSEPGTFELLLDACYTIWIKAAPEEHMQRVIEQGDMRPMAGNAEAMADLRRILSERDPLYSKADAAVDTAGKDEADSVAELRRVLAAAGNGARRPAK